MAQQEEQEEHIEEKVLALASFAVVAGCDPKTAKNAKLSNKRLTY